MEEDDEEDEAEATDMSLAAVHCGDWQPRVSVTNNHE